VRQNAPFKISVFDRHDSSPSDCSCSKQGPYVRAQGPFPLYSKAGSYRSPAAERVVRRRTLTGLPRLRGRSQRSFAIASSSAQAAPPCCATFPDALCHQHLSYGPAGDAYSCQPDLVVEIVSAKPSTRSASVLARGSSQREQRPSAPAGEHGLGYRSASRVLR
jgi:hypothetical protein